MTEPWQWWPAGKIAGATGCPLANVADHWPLIAGALDRRGILDRDNARGVIATVAIETASTFLPVREAFWMSEDWRRQNHRYYPFDGRGYLQLTWEANYRTAGEALGIDLLSDPERAMVPSVAADVLAWYWATRGVKSKDGSRWYSLPELCRARDWEWVRRVVQGGTAGLDRFVQIVNDLGETSVAPSFDPNTPTELQRQDWTCSIRSVMWMLKSLGIAVTPEEAQDAMEGRYVTPQLGLLDASGAGMVAVMRDRWGVGATNDASATFDEVAALAGRQPLAIGLRNWGGPNLGHWSPVRGFDGERLILANPAGTGPQFGQQTLTRQEFDARGPASLVTVPIGSEPQPDPRDARIAQLEAEKAQLVSTLGYLTGDVAGAIQAALDTLKRHAPAS